MSVNLYYKLILINKFIKHNQEMTRVVLLNILIYIYTLIFTISFLFVINFFIKLSQPHDLGCTTYM
jgi:hypothetical protein